MTLRAIVAGDADPFLDALVTLVFELEEKLEIVAWTKEKDEAVRLAEVMCPDIALVSADDDGSAGEEITRAIVEANPACRVIVIGADGSAGQVERAWSAGAAGFVTLDAFSIDLLALALNAEETRLQTRASFPAVALP
jgi:two-component system, NarL family, response regulator DesR